MKKASFTEISSHSLANPHSRFKTRSKEILLSKMLKCWREDRLQRSRRAIRRMPRAILIY